MDVKNKEFGTKVRAILKEEKLLLALRTKLAKSKPGSEQSFPFLSHANKIKE